MALSKMLKMDVSVDDLSEAFDEPLTKEKVLAIAKPFIKA